MTGATHDPPDQGTPTESMRQATARSLTPDREARSCAVQRSRVRWSARFSWILAGLIACIIGSGTSIASAQQSARGPQTAIRPLNDADNDEPLVADLQVEFRN